MRLAALLFLSLSAFAQTRAPYVRASGEGIVTVRPDQVAVTVGVTTVATTAQEASEQNAATTEGLLSRLRSLVGDRGEIRTVSYSVTPQYRYPSGQTPVLTGYQCTNSIQVLSDDLNLGGRIIDTAAQAGATTISGLSFRLKNSEPMVREALKRAVEQARAHAEAMASGLSARVGRVVSVEEASAVRAVTTNDRLGAPAATTTPIESGTFEVRASVVLEAELLS
jgi:hypothetical protein